MALSSGPELPLLPGSWAPYIPSSTRGLKQTLLFEHTLELPNTAGGRSGWEPELSSTGHPPPSLPPASASRPGPELPGIAGQRKPWLILGPRWCGWPRTIHAGRPAPLTVGYSSACSSSVLCGTYLCHRSSGPGIASLPLQSKRTELGCTWVLPKATRAPA